MLWEMTFSIYKYAIIKTQYTSLFALHKENCSGFIIKMFFFSFWKLGFILLCKKWQQYKNICIQSQNLVAYLLIEWHFPQFIYLWSKYSALTYGLQRLLAVHEKPKNSSISMKTLLMYTSQFALMIYINSQTAKTACSK